MDRYRLLKPSCYGELGPGTVLDRSVHPPLVHHLHFVLDGPPRDDLHTSFPVNMVSGRLGQRITEVGLSGAELGEMQVEVEAQYLKQHPGTPTPEIKWLKVPGRARVDDFGLDERGRLVVSAAAMQVLQQFQLDDCRVYDADRVPSPEQLTEELWEKARRSVEQTRRDHDR